eukprot:1597687-Ditylum_brightwellii.AAC.1
MIAFGMKIMLVHFQDQYYNYKGVVNCDENKTNEDGNGLAIGAYTSAFCADISTAYTYKMCNEIFAKLKYAGSYCGDGLVIFKSKKTCHQTITWLCNFQLCMNEVTK